MGITVNKLTNEFVIHGIDIEYDYYYISQKRNEIIEIINDAYKKLDLPNFKFSLLTEKSLKSCVTTEKDKKLNPSFTKMKTNKLSNIDDFLNTGINKKSETDKNDKIIKPKFETKTIYSIHKSVKNVKLEDFKILKVIDRGSFGKINFVEYLPTHETYAMKSLKKDILIEKNLVENNLLEKEILLTIDYPLLCGLVFCFQTDEKIYFITPFLEGGDLFQHLKTSKHFSEEGARFYGAQIALALEYLHNKGIIYCDLKPEKILMDEQGYLKLADFGTTKKVKNNEKILSFCGTPDYLAPEVITKNDIDKMADWWSFGILLFEMLCGIPPFYAENINKIYEMITNGTVQFPQKINISDEAKDIIQKLLEKNPKKRLGSQNGILDIKKHPFFSKIDFNLIEQKKIEAPFKPNIDNNTYL